MQIGVVRLLTTKLNTKMNTGQELFGELHEQEENGLFGNEHRRQYEAQKEALRLSAVMPSLPDANPHICHECSWQCTCYDQPCSCCSGNEA